MRYWEIIVNFADNELILKSKDLDEVFYFSEFNNMTQSDIKDKIKKYIENKETRGKLYCVDGRKTESIIMELINLLLHIEVENKE